jgi:hypothetical protein
MTEHLSRVWACMKQANSFLICGIYPTFVQATWEFTVGMNITVSFQGPCSKSDTVFFGQA